MTKAKSMSVCECRQQIKERVFVKQTLRCRFAAGSIVSYVQPFFARRVTDLQVFPCHLFHRFLSSYNPTTTQTAADRNGHNVSRQRDQGRFLSVHPLCHCLLCRSLQPPLLGTCCVVEGMSGSGAGDCSGASNVTDARRF